MLSSRLFCRLEVFDDSKKWLEVAHYAHERFISQLHFHDRFPRNGPETRRWNHSVWVENEKFWLDISKNFGMISTVHVGKAVNKEIIQLLDKIATYFTSVKTVSLSGTLLFDTLDKLLPNWWETQETFEHLPVSMNKPTAIHVLRALEKIPRLRLVLDGRRCCFLQRLMPLKLNLELIFIDFVSFTELDQRISVLASVYSKFKCDIHIKQVSVTCNLSESLEGLLCIPNLKIDMLNFRHCQSAVKEEKHLCFHPSPGIVLKFIQLYCPFYVHNWSLEEIISPAILKCKTLKSIECFGKITKVTLYQMFSKCPFVEMIYVSLTYNQWKDMKIRYRIAHNHHSRELRIQNVIDSDITMPVVDLVSVLPFSSYLREFELSCYNINNTIFTKLQANCTNIRKLKLQVWNREENSIDMNLISKIGKLEELELRMCKPLVNETMGNFLFPCLTKLDLFCCYSLTGHTLIEIARACKRLKWIRISYTHSLQCHSLKEAMSLLKDLEEFHLQKCDHINNVTLENVSHIVPSLRVLKLF